MLHFLIWLWTKFVVVDPAGGGWVTVKAETGKAALMVGGTTVDNADITASETEVAVAAISTSVNLYQSSLKIALMPIIFNCGNSFFFASLKALQKTRKLFSLGADDVESVGFFFDFDLDSLFL